MAIFDAQKRARAMTKLRIVDIYR